MKPVPEVLGILEGAREQARAGEIREVFLLARMSDGEYVSAYETNDLDDMLYELGSEIIRCRLEK